MSLRNLDALLAPKSVALIGASSRPHSVGATVLRNLLQGGFQGTLQLVNPKYRELSGMRCHHSVAKLPEVPDLAILCTPARTVPGLIAELGARGTRAAVVLSSGFGDAADPAQVALRQQMLDAARPHLLRILGPNCIGLLLPHLGLNASFAHRNAQPGRLAFVTQSGALMTAVLDWAAARQIGFSRFVSLGDSADVDFGDLLDYLAGDPATDGILLYIEAVTSARKFMSAARAAARNKPVLVVKSGRGEAGARAARSHTGALAGSDPAYDAAIRRAGMLRVDSTEELFDAVETLARARPLGGERLAIMTNGGGPGVMAADALGILGGHLAELSPASLQALNAHLPATWSHANPVDIIGDAPVERYVKTLEVLLREPQADAVLFLHAPSAIVDSRDIAAGVVPPAREAARNVLTCWLGGDAVAEARARCVEAGLPTYATPEAAVRAFMQLVEYRRNQSLLMQIPVAEPLPTREHVGEVQAVIEAALAQGREWLGEPEAKRVLAASGIPVVETRIARDTEAAVQAAEALGYPVALKILSPQISHKSDVGGVALGLDCAEAVREAVQAVLARVARARPDAVLEGFSVQRMVRRQHARELIVGIADDATFGPVILFGHGGTAVEQIADRAIALPPLNAELARDLIRRTRVARLLEAYRSQPAVDFDALVQCLQQVARLVADVPRIAELDINPLLVDEHGVLALDARIRVSREAVAGVQRFAILPYPAELEEWIDWQGSRILLRPIRPEDAAQHLEFFDALDEEDVRSRMFIPQRELPRSQLARLTQVDYDREMAFIATREREDGSAETLGVVRALSDPDHIEAEFAIVIRSDLKRRGLGRILMDKLIRYSRTRGTQRLVGMTLTENQPMRQLARSEGFSVVYDREDGAMRLRLELAPP